MALDPAQAPPRFLEALQSLGRARTRPDVTLVETPAPARIAPFAAAIDGEVRSPGAEASGRFVLLHDPAGQDAWEGEFRIVTLVKAQLEQEVASDDLWADVAWSWLTDSLADVPHKARAGTITRTVSRSYGEIAERPEDVRVEVRASWTPLDEDLEPHIGAWTQLMASCAGVPPLPEGVTLIRGGGQ
ncbi:DUF3000 domain-containing protein [Demequina sp. NBRC 110053]|uniref:DUF3000 domain-containing protein n=1 Tax=Demequina sp. NBRC 110053 TaxID=1570342 RepID=UPI000A050D40|nr:DUF3000 domain-containing protein [Demequina sp. NBRC 110053]